jgi:glutamate synthase domain-containing protein 3
MEIAARGVGHRQLNSWVHQALSGGERDLHLLGVNGQRYLGTGLMGASRITIQGVAGNDLAAFMDGPELLVRGNAQDCVGNTMNGGRVVIDGSAGDVLGYAMRGGRILVRGDVGYRVGIHMKSFKQQIPSIVVGGCAGDFLGEYMAGGTLLVLGLGASPSRPPVGRWVGTGMHGGAIYVRGEVPCDHVSKEVAVTPAGPEDEALLVPLLDDFAATFRLDPALLRDGIFHRLAPKSHRPYGNHYAG